jgi:hypothetical protein
MIFLWPTAKLTPVAGVRAALPAFLLATATL